MPRPTDTTANPAGPTPRVPREDKRNEDGLQSRTDVVGEKGKLMAEKDGLANETKMTQPEVLSTPDVNTLRFFYNLGIDYFRLCVRLPPPNIIASQPPPPPLLALNSHQPVTVNSPPALSTPLPSQVACSSPAAARSQTQKQQTSSVRSLECAEKMMRQLQVSKTATFDEDARKLDKSKLGLRQTIRRLSEPRAATSNRFSSTENGASSSKYMTSQSEDEAPEADDVSEQLMSNGRKNDGGGGSVSSTDIEVIGWTSSPAATSQDSGWLSDASSPTSTRSLSGNGSCSPGHVVVDQQLNDDHVNVDEFPSSVGNKEEEEEDDGDDDVTVSEDDVVARDGATNKLQQPATESVAVVAATAGRSPRYVRPMKEIPTRFRRLLEAEAERVARLCRRLQGTPIVCDVIGQPAPDGVDGMQQSAEARLHQNGGMFVGGNDAGKSFPFDQSCCVQAPTVYQPCYDGSQGAVYQPAAYVAYHCPPPPPAPQSIQPTDFQPTLNAVPTVTWSDSSSTHSTPVVFSPPGHVQPAPGSPANYSFCPVNGSFPMATYVYSPQFIDASYNATVYAADQSSGFCYVDQPPTGGASTGTVGGGVYAAVTGVDAGSCPQHHQPPTAQQMSGAQQQQPASTSCYMSNAPYVAPPCSYYTPVPLPVQ